MGTNVLIGFQWRYVQPDRQIPSMKVSVCLVSLFFFFLLSLLLHLALGPGTTELTYAGMIF